VNQRVKDALEKLVSVLEKSGNLRKVLKQDTQLSASFLRKEISNLKCQKKTVKYEQKELREEIKNAKDELLRRDRQTTRQAAPSVDYMEKPKSSGDQLLLPSDSER